MAIIKKYNAQNKTTYVYDSVSYWDREKQQPRSHRKLIGKIDPETGAIVPTAGRGRKPKKDPVSTEGITENRNTVPAQAGLSRQFPEGADISAMYAECQQELLETRSALAKAEGRISVLTAERQGYVRQLERILEQMKN